jgi:hypothetical protein
MEELHFGLNICRYDRRYLTVRFYARPVNIFGFEIIVQGSNENRPKVLVGDCMKLRPVAEDLRVKLSDWLSGICPIPSDWNNLSVQLTMFEINAIVSYYDLRTEKVPFLIRPACCLSCPTCVLSLQVTCKCSFPPLDVLIEKLYQHTTIEVVSHRKSQIIDRLATIFYDPKVMCQLMSKIRYHLRFSFEPTGYHLVHKVQSSLYVSLTLSR